MEPHGCRECPVCLEKVRAKTRICHFCGTPLGESPTLARAPGENLEIAGGSNGHATSSRDGLADLADLRRRLQLEDQRNLLDLTSLETTRALTLRHRRRLENFRERGECQYRLGSVLCLGLAAGDGPPLQTDTGSARDLRDTFHEVCARAVENHNGFLISVAGSVCIAVFGVPVSYDRDAESGVRAALEVQEQVRRFPEIRGARVMFSAGMDTGDILTAFMERGNSRDLVVFGPAPRLARQIEEQAGPDSILVSPYTWNFAEKSMNARRTGPQPFKDLRKPISLFEIVGEKNETVDRWDRTTPFVDREREKARMAEAWEQFLKGAPGKGAPRPAGVIVNGAPGIGKSRLIAEFADSIAAEAKVLRGEVGPHHLHDAYSLWRSVVARCIDLPQGGENKWAAVRDAIPLKPRGGNERRGLALVFGDPDTIETAREAGAQTARRWIISDLQDLLDTIRARYGRLVVWLDDLQWADAGSVELLQNLIGSPTGRGCFFVLAHRVEMSLRSPPFSRFRRIRLCPLREEGRDQLARHLLERYQIPPRIVGPLTLSRSGNPLFLVETVRNVMGNLEGTGALALKDIQLARRVNGWIPRSLKAVLQSRVDLLPENERRVLECAAVVGARFSYGMLLEFDEIRHGLLPTLYGLRRREFIVCVPAAQGPEFRFAEHLLRESVYQGMDADRRRRLHRQVAEALDRAGSRIS